MSEWEGNWPQPRKPGCMATLGALLVLPVIAPLAAIFQQWRMWRRGGDIRVELAVRDSECAGLSTVDCTWDVPRISEPGFGRRLTDVVIRVAEALRRPDDVYNVIYRLPTDTEPVALPVGPQLQELGERFFLVLNQGALARRTVVWLTLAREQSLSSVVDTAAYDPEMDGEPDGLMDHESIRWSMATERADIGPSLVIRIILKVPSDETDRVRDVLTALC